MSHGARGDAVQQQTDRRLSSVFCQSEGFRRPTSVKTNCEVQSWNDPFYWWAGEIHVCKYEQRKLVDVCTLHSNKEGDGLAVNSKHASGNLTVTGSE